MTSPIHGFALGKVERQTPLKWNETLLKCVNGLVNVTVLLGLEDWTSEHVQIIIPDHS